MKNINQNYNNNNKLGGFVSRKSCDLNNNNKSSHSR